MNQYLRAFTNFTQDDWVDWLPLVEFASNNQTSDTTGVSPFYANYGYNPRLGIEPPDLRPPNLTESIKKEYLRADIIAERFDRILGKLHALTRQSRDRYENNANTRRSESPIYQPRDKVMIILKNLKTNRPKKKWDDKWDGRYRVLMVYNGAVIVELPDHIHVNKSFHTSLVRPWTEPILAGQSVINSLENRNVAGRIAERGDDGNILEKCEFEKILDVHADDSEKSGPTYLIKWKYDNKATWQPQADLEGCEKDLQEFDIKNPDKPGPQRKLAVPLILQAKTKPLKRRSKQLRRLKLNILN